MPGRNITNLTPSYIHCRRNAARCDGEERHGEASSFIEPVACAEVIPRFGFAAARRGTIIITPAHQRRQRHQDGFRAPARLQAEVRAAIIDQIEFDVAPAPYQLELALRFGVRRVTSPLSDGHVSRQECAADSPHEIEDELDAAPLKWPL